MIVLTGWWIVVTFIAAPIALLWAGVLLQKLGHHGTCEDWQDDAFNDGYRLAVDRMTMNGETPATWEGPPPEPPAIEAGLTEAMHREHERWQQYRDREGVPDGVSPHDHEAMQPLWPDAGQPGHGSLSDDFPLTSTGTHRWAEAVRADLADWRTQQLTLASQGEVPDPWKSSLGGFPG